MALRFAALACGALAACLVGVFVGGSVLPPGDVLAALVHPRSDDASAIVWSLRVPRVAIAAFVGATLAMAGVLLQALLRNPLVDPFLTGVSAGAGAAIAIAVALGIGAAFVPGIGFGAGLATALLVAFLARRGGGLDVERLILAGVSLSALFGAILTLVLVRLGRGNGDAILAWLAGSLASRGPADLAAAAPYAVLAAALAALATPSLNALRLGAPVARAVGVDVARTQWLVLAAATLLTAAAVALAGVVGFVGLIVPHVVRRLVGTDIRPSLVAAALLGGALVPLADAAARAISPPTEVPLGVVLAFAGVPTFLYLYLRTEDRGRSWGT